MTMRTYRHFACSNSHQGVEKTSENDQPYSKMWESITVTGMLTSARNSDQDAEYHCELCRQPMIEVKRN